MSGKTDIQWTDATWNPVTGCTKVSPGCKHCYAERVSLRTFAHQTVVEDVGADNAVVRKREFTDVLTHPNRLDQPLHWRKPRRVFVNSMSDLFHDDVDEEFITKVFSVMAAASWHTFQILTKRPLRMFRYIESHKRTLSLMSEVWPIPNIWLGVSVESWQYATRLYELAQTPAAVRFCSYEPALSHVNFRRIEVRPGLYWDAMTGAHEAMASGPHIPLPPILPGLDWMIFGGESGLGARACNIQWARDAKEQCGILTKFFFKQAGANPYEETGHDDIRYLRMKDRKGGDMSEWPEDLRVRQYPEMSPVYP